MNHEVPEPMQRISRREKRAFIWTGVWTGAGLLALGGTFALSQWIAAEFRKLPASTAFLSDGDLSGLERILDRALHFQIACSVTLILSALGFLINLVRWLLAIRKRRQLEAALFPHR